MKLSKLKKYIDEIQDKFKLEDIYVQVEANYHMWEEELEIDIKDAALRHFGHFVLIPSQKLYTIKEETAIKELQRRNDGLDRRIDIDSEYIGRLKDKIEELEKRIKELEGE